MPEKGERRFSWRTGFLAFAGCLAIAAVAAPGTIGTALPTSNPSSIKAEIRQVADGWVAGFYARRGYHPIWTDGRRLKPEAEQFLTILRQAYADGLDPKVYGISRLEGAVREARGGAPEALARAETLLSEALASYVRDLKQPHDAAGMIYIDDELVPRPPSREAILLAAARAPDLGSYLASVRRMHPIYEQLRDGLIMWRERWGNLPQVRIAEGPALKPGATGERVALLRQRLGLVQSDLFDAALEERIAAFKMDHGLDGDPVVDRAAVRALNQDPRHFENLILANLERARTLPTRAGRHIIVDAAAARLWLYEDGKPVDSMKVIVGKPAMQTPMLAGLVRFVVLNPFWNVPPDLAQTGIARAVLERGVDAVAERRLQLLSDWTDNARILDPAKIDWAAVASGKKLLRVRQLPGDDNMMGDVKFMMPNEYGIYLHDTPNKALFGQGNRRLSSGCVRIEDARRLASWMFGHDILSARTDEPEKEVYLPRPVPVYITYMTVAPTEQGFAVRNDVYGQDAALVANLSRPGQPRFAFAGQR